MKTGENKFDVGNFVTVELAQKLYEEFGIATIITDGRYIQIEKSLPPTKQNRLFRKIYLYYNYITKGEGYS